MTVVTPIFSKKLPRGRKYHIHDITPNQIEELAEVRFPALREQPNKLAIQKKALAKKLHTSAQYCVLPWRYTAIKTLPEKYFFELQTARNKNLITSSEQQQFYARPIAVAGLSVGSNIARLCTLQGGAKNMNVADADVIGSTNLNRILAGIQTVGHKKTEVLAEALYELNPFARIHTFSDGITEKNAESFFYVNNKKIAVLVEEVDNLGVKVLLRTIAARLKVPVVSVADNADGAIVEVERYDREFTFARFRKRLAPLAKLDPAQLTIQQKAIAITKYIGAEHIPNRMLESVLAVGSTLYSWPQLGGAAVLSGVLGAYCVRALTTGVSLQSGTYIINLDSFFNVEKKNHTRRKALLTYFK